MKKRKKLRIYTLKGSTEPESIDRRQAFLTSMFETAKAKGMEVAQLRQRNLNYAIIIFAGLFTLSSKFTSDRYAVSVSAALWIIMVFFALLDRKYHKYIHGWRQTEKMFMGKITKILNDPRSNVSFVRYIGKAEKKAELFGTQPWIAYSLVIAGGLLLAYRIFVVLGD